MHVHSNSSPQGNIVVKYYRYATIMYSKNNTDKLITLHQNNPSLGMNKKHWFNSNILRGVPFQTLEKMINLGLLFEISIFSI